MNSELRKIETRIETLRLRDASCAVVDPGLKIEKLARVFGVEYRVYVVSR